MKRLIISAMLGAVLLPSCQKNSLHGTNGDPLSPPPSPDDETVSALDIYRPLPAGFTALEYKYKYRNSIEDGAYLMWCEGTGNNCAKLSNGGIAIKAASKYASDVIDNHQSDNTVIPDYFLSGSWSELFPELESTNILTDLQNGTLSLYKQEKAGDDITFFVTLAGATIDSATDILFVKEFTFD